MTERSRGAPDPVGPSPCAGPRDLGAVRRTDAIFDALAARRAAGSARRSGGVPDPGDDPAVHLLRALIDDVDDTAATEPAEAPTGTPSGPGPGPRRRGPRTIVALGVAGAVLASTGVAAAGSGLTGHSGQSPSAAGVRENARPVGPEPTDSRRESTAPAPRPVQPPPARSRPEPKPSVPADEPRANDPARERTERIERLKNRLESLLPPEFPSEPRPRKRSGRPDRSGPSHGPEYGFSPRSGPPERGDDDTKRTLDDIRRRAHKHFNDRHR